MARLYFQLALLTGFPKNCKSALCCTCNKNRHIKRQILDSYDHLAWPFFHFNQTKTAKILINSIFITYADPVVGLNKMKE